MRTLAIILAALLPAMSATAQTTQVLLKADSTAVADKIDGLSRAVGAKIERQVPGLNATILQVPNERLDKLISAANSASGFSAIENLGGNDYRQLFKNVPSADLNLASLSQAQLDAVSRLRGRASSAAVYVSEMRPAGISTDLLKGALTMADGFPLPKGIKLNLAPGVSVSATQIRIDQQAGGGFIWYGKIDNSTGPGQQESGVASLVVDGNKVSGTVAVGTDVYTINPLGDGMHAIVKISPRAYPGEHPPGANPASPSNVPAAPQRGGALEDQGPPTIRALVLYTPSVRQAVSDPDTVAKDAVANTNAASLNSRVAMNLVLAKAAELNYVEQSFEADLAMLHSSPIAAQLRTASQAQVVFLLTTVNTYCGLSDAIMAQQASAFAVINYDCAVGNFSLAHEFGHLLGLRHDRVIDPTDTPFKNGHGYVHHDDWRTIMAYADACNQCPRIPIWSNPSLSYNGVPSGTVDYENEAGVINKTAPIVAQFH